MRDPCSPLRHQYAGGIFFAIPPQGGGIRSIQCEMPHWDAERGRAAFVRRGLRGVMCETTPPYILPNNIASLTATEESRGHRPQFSR